MSKKAKRKLAKKLPKKASGKSIRVASRTMKNGGASQGRTTNAATIFVYDTGGGVRVRTSPQLLSCAPGYIEWTVVNLTSGPMPDVDITWQDGSGPWGQPIPIRGGNARKSLAGAREGR
ncbi:MAG TPA: hypothetical protein VEA16_20845, partial [Vicinamibacterales bacterium]|nr:hypothetical protein [Vicinamibacterales bacterium]